MQYSVVDLFAGAGGLSLGFLQTERFEVVVAAENNPHAQKTYKKNHPLTDLEGDVCKINYNEITAKYGKIDVVIGGPPCQGFSNANRQKTNAVSENNRLVKEYVRAVCELKPDIFVMENVDMLKSEVHRFYCTTADRKIVNELNIPLRNDTIELLPDSVTLPKADDIVRDIEKLTRYIWKDKDYSAINILYRQRNNEKKMHNAVSKYHTTLLKFAEEKIKNGDNKDLIIHYDYVLGVQLKNAIVKPKKSFKKLVNALASSILIQRMIKKRIEIEHNQIIVENYKVDQGLIASVKSYSVVDYITKTLSSPPYNYKMDSRTLNAADFGAPQKRQRYIIIGVNSNNNHAPSFPTGTFAPSNYRTVWDAIADLEEYPVSFSVDDAPKKFCEKRKIIRGSLLEYVRKSNTLFNHVATASTEDAIERFKMLKPGQKFRDLPEKLKTNTYTDASRTQNTIYVRLNYNEPSGTVLNIRKSMWVHPVLNRALSIREAARLQTFPDDFIFKGPKDAQYQQVGNAVPPILANAVANEVIEILDRGNCNGEALA